MLRAVIFDLDDTLIDWSGRQGDWLTHIKSCLRPIYEYLCGEGRSIPSLDELAQAYLKQAHQQWEAVCPPDWVSPHQRDILGKTLESLQLDPGSLDVDELQRLYGWTLIPGVRLFQDTTHVLTTLRAQGIKIGLITNADLPMWMRDTELKILGVLEYIDVRLTASDVGHLKPHPAPFREALNRLGVTPDEAIFVGDRLQDDVAGAQTAGMRAVWVRRASSPWPSVSEGTDSLKPNATINHLRELISTLDLWFPGWRSNEATQSNPV